MDIHSFQTEILELFSQMDELPGKTEHTKQSALIHLFEEVGEVARQVTNEVHRPEKFDKSNLGSELADTLMFLVFIAKLYDIDLSDEMKKGIERVKVKIEKLKQN